MNVNYNFRKRIARGKDTEVLPPTGKEKYQGYREDSDSNPVRAETQDMTSKKGAVLIPHLQDPQDVVAGLKKKPKPQTI